MSKVVMISSLIHCHFSNCADKAIIDQHLIGTWSVGGGIQLPCTHTLHALDMYHSLVRALQKEG